MSSSSSANQTRYHQRIAFAESNIETICSHCGGNGYLKTSPNCYHTCIECLGRGSLIDDNDSSLE